MKKVLLFFMPVMLLANKIYAQPANDEPCNAIALPVGSTGCEPTTVYSFTAPTYSAAAGAMYCVGVQGRDVWYKATVPPSGSITVALGYASTYNVAVEVMTGTSCSSLAVVNRDNNGFPCLYGNSSDRITYKNLTAGSTIYLRVFTYNVSNADGSIKICVSNPAAMADEPCDAGYFPVGSADPLGQVCVPTTAFNWVAATLTPAVPNPSCIQNMPAADIRDVWFKVKVPASGKLQINTTSSYDFYNNSSAWNYVVAYTTSGGCSGTFTETGCVMSWTGTPLRWTGLTPGTDIYIRMFRYYSANNGGNGDARVCAESINTLPSVDNAKNVGVGIDSPFAKLDVVGTGIFRDKLTAGKDVEVRGNLIVQGNIISKYGNTSIGANTTQNGNLVMSGTINMDSLAFNNRLGNHISLYGGLGNNNQYGFGIQSGLLQIYSDALYSNIAFGYGNSNNFIERARIENGGDIAMTLKGRLNLRASGTSSAGIWLNSLAGTSQVSFIGLAADNKVGFYGNSGLGWDGLVMNTLTGSIGLHNQNPTTAKLVIGGSNGEEGIDLSTSDQYANMRVIRNSLFAADKDMYIGYQSGGVSSLHLYSNNNETVTIKNSNLGIANSNPARPLSFPASLGEKILLYPGANGEVGIGVYGNELRLHADNPGAKVSFGTQDNAGNFDETALAQRNGVYAFSVKGSLWVNGTTYASDERFKKNITSIASPLEKLLLLNGVEYEMNTAAFPQNHFATGRQIGLIAQNVEKVIPDAVNEKDGYKGVDYARLVPLLIEAIKEQQKEIELLKSRINR